MVYFITGASSFIGIELCRYLTELGHTVIGVSRRQNGRLEELTHLGHFRVIQADMHNLVEKAKGLKSDVFIHLAWGGTSRMERDNPQIHSENVRLSKEFVRLAKLMRCQLFVDAGSQAEYGIVSGAITEDTVCHPVTEYGKSKLRMSRESKVLAMELGLKYIHLRIFSVYGEHDHEDTLIMTSLIKMRKGEPVELRGGGQKWNYLYVKDAARIITVLCVNALNDDSFRSEVYNVASNDTRRLKDFVSVMKRVCNSSSVLSFGGYNPEMDVNLDPDMTKTAGVVKPLTYWAFEDVIQKMVQ